MAKKESNKEINKPAAAISGRTRKLSKSQQRAKAKKQAKNQKPLPGSFKLTARVIATLWKFWKPLGGIFIIYVALNAIFVTGLISGLDGTASRLAQSHGLSNAVRGFGSLLGSGTSVSTTGVSMAQTVLLILESLVIIWALRQLLAGEKIKVKQAYYQATAPFIPFILVFIVIIQQLLPLVAGSAILSLVLVSAVATNALVTVVAYIVLGLLAAWSAYMISGSIFALYIVTLPNMQPRQALRSAKNLVHYRRWEVLRRLVFLPIAVLLLMAIIIVPVILIASFAVAISFFILSLLAVLFVHTYLYSLYRGLIA